MSGGAKIFDFQFTTSFPFDFLNFAFFRPYKIRKNIFLCLDFTLQDKVKSQKRRKVENKKENVTIQMDRKL